MKQKTLKVLITVLIVAMSLSVFVACNPKEPEIPEFSFSVVNGSETISITNNDVKGLTLHNFSNTSKEVTSYYKGFKISDLLKTKKLKGIDLATVESLTISDGTTDERGTTTLLKANFDNAYFAVFYSAEENGTFEPIGAEKGPVRLFDLSAENSAKSIKNVKTVTVNKAAA